MLSHKELLKEELQKDYSKPPKATKRIIEIGSYGLNASQQNLPATQREMYTIFTFLEQWSHYIGNQKMHIYTDAT
ncbi:20097_t:CDS:1, partial [Gigaspora rosea]